MHQKLQYQTDCMCKLLIGFFCTFCLCLQSAAQEPYTEFGYAPGVAYYQGDLSPYRLGTLHKPGLSLQLFRNFGLTSAWSVRVGYAFAFLHEDDATYSGYKLRRNFSFQAKVNELSSQLIFNPLMTNGEEEIGTLTPYLTGGVGFALVSLERDWSKFDYNYKYWQTWVRPGLAEDSAKAVPKTLLTFPVGAGLRYLIGENFSLFAEVTHRFTREEYLDGFSKAANRKNKDGFSTVTVGLVFRRITGSYYGSTKRRVY